uniref:Uncharacterized protein n=1 Tax=Strigamia maritima TaxID=126957 RepID=T1JH59_STRMM
MCTSVCRWVKRVISAAVNMSCTDEITQQTSSNDDEEEIDIWVVGKKPNTLEKRTKEQEKAKCKPENDPHLEKFKHLKERRQAMKDRSDHLRAKNLSRKAKKAARRTMREPAVREELEKLQGAVETDTSRSTRAISNDAEAEWGQVKKYINVNKHLVGPVDHGWCGPKTDLERKIDDAIEKGNLEEAEKLSDQLTSRNFAVKVNEAFQAKKYDEKRKVEKEEEIAKRQKTLNWGFEAKQRWEMKSNL